MQEAIKVEHLSKSYGNLRVIGHEKGIFTVRDETRAMA